MAKVVLKKDESFESMLRRWKKKVKKDTIMEDMQKHEYYKSYSVKKREKKAESMKRIAIAEKKLAKFRDKYNQ